MPRVREMLASANRYVYLAGRSCCAGRSWVGLNRSLARRANDPSAGACDLPSSGDPQVPFVDADREPDEATFASSSSPKR